MRLLTQDDFNALWPVKAAGVEAQVQGILTTQAAAFAHCQIDDLLVLAHMMAQFSEETGGGVEMVESLNYSPQGLLETWPTHFSPAQAQQYGRTAAHPADQPMIGDLAYNNRMGNKTGTSDGYTYRGRGFIQTTGRDGYTALAHKLNMDLLGHPELLVDPVHAFPASVNEFVGYSGLGKTMITYCKEDNVAAVSSLINLGFVTYNTAKINGYQARLKWLAKWKTQLGL